MTGLTEQEQSVLGTLRVFQATGMTASSQDEIIRVLQDMTALLADQDVAGWSQVFSWLSEMHPGICRFNVIRAILLFLQETAGIQRWGATWMAAMEAGGIHPVSLSLCAGRAPDTFLAAITTEYERNFPASRYPRVTGFVEARQNGNGDNPRIWAWRIQMPSDSPVKNLLSSLYVKVLEPPGASMVSLGEGWCVRALTCGQMPALSSLGPNLVVITDLDARLAPNLKTIMKGSRVGGTTWVWKALCPTGTTQRRAGPKGKWDNHAGWIEAGSHWKSDRWGKILVLNDSEWSGDPILVPESCSSLTNGHWEI